ncbi:unnamed protein product [Diatraea saccharalis]|uniref:Ubiquinone biosynthesis O-methyltransferase, mitochondrial n=1 Tax=Diatraea saccharalis TaxID=40085 RepID=A0A9P0C867_9NEOP|nr:unnamed protein product [Diatraea saccharalis]
MAQIRKLMKNHWLKNVIDTPVLSKSITSANAAKTENSTIKEDEIKMFSNQNEDWWNLNGPAKALHSMNAIRVPLIRDGLVQCPYEDRTPTPLKDKKILDVGCGGGILSEALAKIGAEVTGIDASRNLIDIAQEHCQENIKLINKPKYVCTTVEEHLNDHNEYYDGVVASEVIEHVANKELFIKSCVGVLKPGGRIFFTTPNRTRATQILGICISEYVLNIVPKGTHHYDMLVTPNEMSFLLERNNCHVELIYGLFYNFLQNRWSFVNSQMLLFAIQAQKLE